ncbi:MAG: Crp/Fnr family transcriptional regulator [Saprospiraceae bacterium]
MNPIEELKSRLLDNYAELWQEKTLKRNEFLKVQGSRDANMYYVEEGTVRAYIETEYEEQTIRFGYKGSFIGALDSFLTGRPSPFYLQAIKKSQLKVITRTNFLKFVQADTTNLQLYCTMLEMWAIQQMEREMDILTYSPRERYERVFKRSPHLFQEIPAKYIASYLRMSPETLSRLKKS